MNSVSWSRTVLFWRFQPWAITILSKLALLPCFQLKQMHYGWKSESTTGLVVTVHGHLLALSIGNCLCLRLLPIIPNNCHKCVFYLMFYAHRIICLIWSDFNKASFSDKVLDGIVTRIWFSLHRSVCYCGYVAVSLYSCGGGGAFVFLYTDRLQLVIRS